MRPNNLHYGEVSSIARALCLGNNKRIKGKLNIRLLDKTSSKMEQRGYNKFFPWISYEPGGFMEAKKKATKWNVSKILKKKY